MRERLPGAALRALLLVWFLTCAGTWAFVVALAVDTLDSHGVGAVGGVLAARLIPALIAAPVTARLVDRHNRGLVVAATAAVEALAFGGAAVAVLSGAPFALVLVAVAVGGAAGTGPRPALEALMPGLATSPGELTRATALWSALDNFGFLLGSGIGGVAVAATGTGAVMGAGSALIAAGAGTALLLPAVTAIEPDEEPGPDGLVAEALGGFQALREVPELRTPMLLFAGLLLLEGISDVLLVTLAIRDLGMGNGGPGILYAVFGAAGLSGSALTLFFLRRRGYGLALAVGVLVLGVGVAALGLDGVPLAIAAMIPGGIGFALVETSTMALAPRLADDAVLGRVYGLLEIIYSGMAGLGALIGPLLAAALGAPGGLAAVGVTYAVAGLVCWRSLARLDAGQEEAGSVRELLRAVPFLAPLPLPRLERLVRGARCQVASAGETIVSRGDRGDDFYVVEDGTVEVTEFRRRQGPGTSFGEIALLHDVPRTATVRAEGEVRLRVLERRAFLAAVSGHEDAHERAHAVAAEHLARAPVA